MTDENRILDAAAAPKRAKTAAGEVEAHPLPDQIAADRYAKAKQAAGSPFSAVRQAVFVPPSALGVHRE